MYLRKLVAAAGFATGAALAFAPLAAAVPDPTLVTDTLDSEISSLNSGFEFDALLAGDTADVTKHAAPLFDTILAKDIPQITDPTHASQVTPLEYELYGVNPIAAGITGDSGPYSEFNGALTQFDNAYNVLLYSNGGALDTNINDYIYNGTIQTVVNTQGETATQAFDTLYNHGIGDLSGYFQTNLSFLDIPTAVAPSGSAEAAAGASGLASTVSSEISSANSLFESYATLSGVPAADIIHSTGNFDTLATGLTATPQLEAFETEVFGFNPASVSPDVGAYDLFNGAISKFDDAFNIGLYALENGGSNLPLADFATDLFGISGTTATTLAGESATQAITTLFGDSFTDLAGYF